jgi:type IV conjugative transfer system protein TraL
MAGDYEYTMPKRVNDPPTLFIWPVHYVIPPFFMIALGVSMSMTLPFLIAGIALFFIIKHVDIKYPPGYLVHRLWSWGLAIHIKETKNIPPSTKREFYQ